MQSPLRKEADACLARSLNFPQACIVYGKSNQEKIVLRFDEPACRVIDHPHRARKHNHHHHHHPGCYTLGRDEEFSDTGLSLCQFMSYQHKCSKRPVRSRTTILDTLKDTNHTFNDPIIDVPPLRLSNIQARRTCTYKSNYR